MNGFISESRFQVLRWGVMGLVALLALAILGAGSTGSAGAAPPAPGADQPAAPLVQQFEDVPDSNPFATFVNNLYLDNIISGYNCGGPGEPCVPPLNLPYYRPNNDVTRAQMSKFVENGRRNIDNAIGERLVLTNGLQVALVISSTTTDSIDANNASGLEAIQANCTRAGVPCYGFYSTTQTGNRAAVFTGSRGTYVDSNDANAYSLDVEGGAYRGAYIKSNDPGFYSLYVDAPITTPTAGNFAGFNTSVNIFGNLNVSGSKGGYVVDLMENAGADALEPGDVVTIVGNAAAVMGEIPVVRVQKATSAYDSGVAGVVDQIMYVPSAELRSAYVAQEQARREAMDRLNRAELDAKARGVEFDLSSITVPEARITDADGNVRVDALATRAQPGAHMNVVTLGSYKAVKVDASFGPIHAGDLLTSSPHAGYAMKVTDKTAAIGAVIGKALGNLESGTGTIPVLVTLK